MKRNIFSITLFIFCLVFNFSLFKAYAKKEITLYTLNWPPYVGEDLKGKGYCYLLVKEVFEYMGYNVSIKFQPWARIMDLAKKGFIDGYFPAYYSDDRATHSYFSQPIIYGPLVFLTLKNKKIKYDNLYDLKDFILGLVRGYVNTKEIDSANFLIKDYAPNDYINIKKLLRGRVDLIVIDKYTGYFLIKKNFRDVHDKFLFLEPVLENKPVYVCFPKKRENTLLYLRDFDHGLKILEQNSTRDTLYKQWLDEIKIK